MIIDCLRAELHTFVQKQAKPGYCAIYHDVTSICRCFVGQYLLETSPRVYSQGWYALDGRNRPSTARDMLTSVNGCPRWPIHAHCCTMAKVDPLHRPMRQYHIIPSKNTYQRAKRQEDLSGALKLMSTSRPGRTAKNAN